MNKITTDIISTTGINISKYDILPSKVFVNGIEITDVESWNKVISSIEDKDKEIERLKEENKKLLQKSYSDDVRITKATKYIKTHYLKPNEPELENILQGE